MGRHDFKPLYQEYKLKPRTRTEIERQRRIKIISVLLITIECILGIGVIMYFAIRGV